ncbi:hypothetical protein, conserved [Entamoeba dispar SAW760]|uniref:Uncharacterized protein n=1 Tax=Entamoeba dispar (strain ATCC PRA-260 / SAW760) TaxID=370354 RepID=B0EDR8_ENTDS|nr:uncharacterized protein EDI_276420 [Entamoeba dispar SAW760]EDR27331.1 hypothetical protein, conserved [Entamoeba dispar SAW760]|eukprot:EDR27331.1 hypothetical protein, conserved [Entamoeba dispar SAW760]
MEKRKIQKGASVFEAEKKLNYERTSKHQTINNPEEVLTEKTDKIKNQIGGVSSSKKKKLCTDDYPDNQKTEEKEEIDSVVASIKEGIKESEIKIMKMQSRKNVLKPKGRKSTTKQKSDRHEEIVQQSREKVGPEEITKSDTKIIINEDKKLSEINLSEEQIKEKNISQEISVQKTQEQLNQNKLLISHEERLTENEKGIDKTKELQRLDNEINRIKQENEAKRKRIHEMKEIQEIKRDNVNDIEKIRDNTELTIKEILKNVNDKQEKIERVLNEIKTICHKERIVMSKEIGSIEEMEMTIKEQNKENEQMIENMKRLEDYFVQQTNEFKKIIEEESKKRQEEQKKEETMKHQLNELKYNKEIGILKEKELAQQNNEKQSDKDDLMKEVQELQEKLNTKKKERLVIKSEEEKKLNECIEMEKEIKELQENHLRIEEQFKLLKSYVDKFNDKKWLCLMKEEEQIELLATIVVQYKLSHQQVYEKSVIQIFDEIVSKKIPINEWKSYVVSAFNN